MNKKSIYFTRLLLSSCSLLRPTMAARTARRTYGANGTSGQKKKKKITKQKGEGKKEPHRFGSISSLKSAVVSSPHWLALEQTHGVKVDLVIL